MTLLLLVGMFVATPVLCHDYHHHPITCNASLCPMKEHLHFKGRMYFSQGKARLGDGKCHLDDPSDKVMGNPRLEGK